MSQQDDPLQEFLLESEENLDRLDQDLVALESEGADRARLDRIFRTIHTIKGTCGFFAFDRLGALTHAGEGLLGRLRDGQLSLTAEVVTALLGLVDSVRRRLAAIAGSGSEGDFEDGPLIAALNRLREGEASPAEEPAPAEPAAPAGELPAAGTAEGFVRVSVGLLDRLMNLAGELVLARNHIAQLAEGGLDAGLLRASGHLGLITTELQEGVLKARMQPIACLWDRFPRLVRDLAVACGKQVRLDLEGRDTELDRSVLDAVKDPLTHLVRNAIDHGLEAPAARQALGKPPQGRLALRAFHENGQVVIEVADDGGGIDPRAIERKALERGLISADLVGRLGERELFGLIFLPGFSTAAKVSSVSGRGVGMDVVKTNVEQVGGSVDLDSRPGQGTVVRLRIPLTLAIVPALIVTTGGDRYAIPQASLVELVRLAGDQARCRIEEVHGVPVYRLRGRLLPLLYLHRELGVEPIPAAALYIVVLQVAGRLLGLVVDRVNDTQEIVVKPLARQLKRIRLFAGATVLGDGQVALILDVPALARAAGLAAGDGRPVPAARPSEPLATPDDRQRLLLCGLGQERRLAIPLALVDRLEVVPSSAVETACGREVLQHRGRILPLVRLSRVLGQREPARPAVSLHVVVCSEAGRDAGLVVDEIVDTVEAAVDLQYPGTRPGIAGSAVVAGRVTDLLDVPQLLRDPQEGR